MPKGVTLKDLVTVKMRRKNLGQANWIQLVVPVNSLAPQQHLLLAKRWRDRGLRN